MVAGLTDDTPLYEILEVLGAPKNSTRAQVQHLSEVANKMAKSLKYQVDKITVRMSPFQKMRNYKTR